MKVMITGGTGFLGMNLAENLLTKGVDVVLFARSPLVPQAEQALSKLKGNVAFVKGDILDGNSVEQAIRGNKVDCVVHAAVVTPDDQREKEEAKKIVAINFMGFVEVLEACRETGVSKLVYTSSASVYGDASYPEGRIEEDTVPIPRALYAVSKQAAEGVALRYKKLFGMNIAVARIGGVFGPWERYTGVRDTLSGPFLTTRAAFMKQNVVLPRPGVKDWVYSRDVADEIVALLESSKLNHDIYNLSASDIWTVEDWCKKLTERFEGFQYRVSASGRDANIDFFDVDDRSPLNIDRLVQDTGFLPRYGLDKSFDDYMQWVRDNPWTLKL